MGFAFHWSSYLSRIVVIFNLVLDRPIVLDRPMFERSYIIEYMYMDVLRFLCVWRLCVSLCERIWKWGRRAHNFFMPLHFLALQLQLVVLI